LTWTGYDALARQGGWASILRIGPINDAQHGGTDVHAHRLYIYLPAAQRLCLFHAAWEVKSFVDSVAHNDGVLFLFHHIGAFFLSLVAMQPVYHVYVCYFLGLIELSSIPLPAVAMLDESLGLGPDGLGKKLPVAKDFFGGLFALFFLTVRVAVWIVVGRNYFVDSFAVLHGDDCKSVPLIVGFIVALVLFTILQLIWAVELVRAIYAFVATMTQQIVKSECHEIPKLLGRDETEQKKIK